MLTDSSLVLEGRYQLIERRGERGGVESYDALDTLLERPVTVQMLSREAASGPDSSRRFLHHQQIAASLTNCPLLSVYDAGTWQGRPFSVMEQDKGAPPQSLYEPGKPPDVLRAIRLSGQIAEALQCCREAGLSDWCFTPEAVRIKDDGDACLAIYEGLEGEYGSSHPSGDAKAMAAVLALILTGKPDPGEASLRAALVPPWFVGPLTRIDPRLGGSAVTAEDFARDLENIEAAADSPTEAYVPPPDTEEPEPSLSALTASMRTPAELAEAPTLPASLPQSSRRSNTTALPEMPATEVPYTPPPDAIVPERERATRQVSPAVPMLIGLVLLGLLGALAVTRLSGAKAAPTAASTAGSGNVQPVQVPDLKGKSMDDARSLVGKNGLNLAAGAPVYDVVPRDTVASQEPGPGTTLQAGQLVTVSLSLGPEPTPTRAAQVQPPAQPVQPVQPAPQPAAKPPPAGGHPPGNGHKDEEKGGGKKGKGDK